MAHMGIDKGTTGDLGPLPIGTRQDQVSDLDVRDSFEKAEILRYHCWLQSDAIASTIQRRSSKRSETFRRLQNQTPFRDQAEGDG